MYLTNTLESKMEETAAPLTKCNKEQQHRGSLLWRFFGKRVPRTQLVFICQIFIIYVVIGTSVYNLSVGNKPSSLWVGLLASCLGYCLPNPSIDPGTYHVSYPPLPSNPPPESFSPIYLKTRQGETWV